MSKAYIVILNWNGWKDTIECLESVFRNNYPDYKVIVCDNCSQDGSMTKIKEWCKGLVTIDVPQKNPMYSLSNPPVKKPIIYTEYNRFRAEKGGDLSDNDSQLILIQTGHNLGFAGGNNVALRYILARSDFEYVWLLNNDTVIDSFALRELVYTIESHSDTGIVGSKVLFYNNPKLIQAAGGSNYHKWLAAITDVGALKKDDEGDLNSPRLDYIFGASMFVNKSFLQSVGLLEEMYFLYYEELDWCIRGKGKKFKTAYSFKSKVYHKSGASIGSNRDVKSRSYLSDYYANRNKILLTKKFYPYALPTVYLRLAVSSMVRLGNGQFDRAKLIASLLLKSLWGKPI